MSAITAAGTLAAAGTPLGAGADARACAGAGAALLERLAGAVNRHDLDDLAGCFAPGYRNETPAHPAQGFTGHDQVRRNWEQILGAIADLHSEVTRVTVDGSTVWSEWEHRGTRPDGSTHMMRGVIVFEVDDGGRFSRATFYLEPVQEAAGTVDEAVRRQVTRSPS